MNACPSLAVLQALLANALPPTEEEPVAAHIEVCASCQQTLERLTALEHSPAPVLSELTRTHDQVSALRHRESSTCSQRRPVSATLGDAALGHLRKLLLVTRSDAGRPASELRSTTDELPTIPGYEILGVLGRGGMGIVYKARHLRLQRLVALKMVLAGAARPEEAHARFLAEGEVLARLQHPNIVQIYDIGFHQQQPYFALELVEGGSLADRLKGQPLPVPAVVRLGIELAHAIDAAHQRGIIHRDLKPSNILMESVVSGPWSVAEDGWRPKVTDFGLAKVIDLDLNLTHTGAVLGTPVYMAPEQVRGSQNQVGPFTDVYALGVILYEALTGRPPFLAGSQHEIFDQVLSLDPVAPRSLRPGLPQDLQTITLKCLEKEPAKRYPTAAALAEDLRRFLAHEPINARPLSLFGRWVKFSRRNKSLVGTAAVVLATLLIGSAVSLLFAASEAWQRTRAETAHGQALGEAYRARLAASLPALRERDFAEASQHLDAAPLALRGWEWQHLHRRLLDERPVELPFAEQYRPFFGLFADGSRMLALVKSEAGFVTLDAQTGTVVRQLPRGTLARIARTDAGPQILIYQPNAPLTLVDRAGNSLQTSTVFGPGYRMWCISPDGTRLAALRGVMQTEDRLELRRLPAGDLLHTYASQGTFSGLAFSPDGQSLAASGNDGTIQHWPVNQPALATILRGHQGRTLGIAFHPDRQRLLSWGEDGTLRQWRLATGELLDVRYGHDSAIWDAAYSNDGLWIASAGEDRTARLWDTAGRETPIILPGHREPVHVVAFHPDGMSLLSWSWERTLRIWPLLMQDDPRILRGHTSYVYPVAFSPNGRWFASGGWDNVIRIWDALRAEPLAVLKGPQAFVASLAVSPDGKRLVSRARDGRLRIWNPETATLVADLEDGGVLSFRPENVAISSDGRFVVCGGDQRVRIWELATGQEQAGIPLPDALNIRHTVLRPDGHQLAVVGRDLFLLDFANRFPVQPYRIRPLPGHVGKVYAATYSPDGRQLVTGGEDLVLRIWDSTTGKLERELHGHTEEIYTAIFHPDGSRLATAGRDRVIRIWDTATGAELARLQGHHYYVYALAFSPDGTTLVSGSGDKTVRLWSTISLRQRRVGHPHVQRHLPATEQPGSR